jgi:hypothetical protein
MIIFVRINCRMMDTKLTLKLDKAVIERAKAYAAICNTSLSKLIERYLDDLTRRSGGEGDPPLSPLVQSLHGIAKLPPGLGEKDDYHDFLAEKHA